MSTTFPRRDDANPWQGEHEYGDVAFTDPIDTPGHIREASGVESIKRRIRKAARVHQIDLDDQG